MVSLEGSYSMRFMVFFLYLDMPSRQAPRPRASCAMVVEERSFPI
jgi:hypothetical protein